MGFSISSPSLLPAAAASSSGGAGRRLRRLFLTGYPYDTVVDEAAATALCSLFQSPPGALPALEQLRIEWPWSEWNEFGEFLATLGEGASPRLRTLRVLLMVWEVKPTRLFDALASALEARRARGCVGLRELGLQSTDALSYLDHCWSTQGDLRARLRLWAVLLPTVEELPEDAFSEDETAAAVLADAIIEHGAPCVRRLTSMAPAAMRCLPYFRGWRS